MILPHYRDGDRGTLVPVPIDQMTDAELTRIALGIADSTEPLTHARSEPRARVAREGGR